MSGELPAGFWIAADAAYTCTESIVTPWPAIELLDPARDAFNFFQSSLRMHVEQVFGQVHSRFGILHNFCIDKKESSVPMEPVEEARISSEFSEWWSESSVSSIQQGKRRDLEVSSTREMLTTLHRARRVTRPSV
jgi:DDE superfamily endonuclease